MYGLKRVVGGKSWQVPRYLVPTHQQMWVEIPPVQSILAATEGHKFHPACFLSACTQAGSFFGGKMTHVAFVGLDWNSLSRGLILSAVQGLTKTITELVSRSVKSSQLNKKEPFWPARQDIMGHLPLKAKQFVCFWIFTCYRSTSAKESRGITVGRHMWDHIWRNHLGITFERDIWRDQGSHLVITVGESFGITSLSTV